MDSRPITDSPKWNIWPFHDFPISRRHGVDPSCPTWNLVRTKAACLTNHLMIGKETSTLHFSLASNPNSSLLIRSVTSCTAFSAPPFACGVYAREFLCIVTPLRASAKACCKAIMAGSPSDWMQMSLRPQSSRSLSNCRITHSSLGPFDSQS